MSSWPHLDKIEREKKEAQKFWASLSSSDRGELGDQFVLGGFDWRDWGFNKRPTSAFMNEVEACRLDWEIGVE